MRYIVTVHKEYADYRWQNRYHVEAGSLSAAADVGEAIAGFEQQIHSNNVHFYRVHARTPVKYDYVYIDRELTGFGALVAESDVLPGWNVLKLNFETALGRPDFKQYRVFLNGSFYDNPRTWTIAYTTVIGTAYQDELDPLIANGSLVDSQGNPWLSMTINRQIQMRQMHRKRRKKVVPAP